MMADVPAPMKPTHSNFAVILLFEIAFDAMAVFHFNREAVERPFVFAKCFSEENDCYLNCIERFDQRQRNKILESD